MEENKAELTRLIMNLMHMAGEEFAFGIACAIGHQEMKLQLLSKFRTINEFCMMCLWSTLTDVNCSVLPGILGPRNPVLCLVLARDSFPDEEYSPQFMSVFPS